MKKLKNFLIVAFIFIFCVCAFGCLDINYDEYYGIISKGGGSPDVFCWEIKENDWRCGAAGRLNMNLPFEKLHFMQFEKPCTLKRMNKILKSYPANVREDIRVFVLPYDISEREYMEKYYMSVYNSPDEETANYLYSQLGLTLPI